MVKSLRVIGYIFFFFLALIYFLPKVNAYYILESELQKYKVINSGERVRDNGFSLSLENSKIFFDSIDVATVDSIDIALFGVYNGLDVKNIELSSFVSSFVPVKIDTVRIRYSILNPLNITASSSGAFGKAYANVNILDRNASVILEPSKVMLQQHKTSLQKFKKNSEGVYSYEKTF